MKLGLCCYNRVTIYRDLNARQRYKDHEHSAGSGFKAVGWGTVAAVWKTNRCNDFRQCTLQSKI